jgi:hypothetical protein
MYANTYSIIANTEKARDRHSQKKTSDGSAEELCTTASVVCSTSCVVCLHNEPFATNSSIAPAEFTGNPDRGIYRVSDTYSLRRLYSSFVSLGQDVATAAIECVQTVVSTIFFDSQKSLAIAERVTSQEIYLAPSITPGPLLVLLVASVLFVF